jgi:hypothetical protein
MIVFNITTSYGTAWLEYLNESIGKENNLIWDYDGIGSFPGDYFFTTNQITDDLVNINMVFNSINKLDCLVGVIKVEVS